MLESAAPPDHLSSRSQSVWLSTVRQYELRPDELELLDQALTQLDRATAARQVIDSEGLTVNGLHGVRLHPLVPVERSAAAAGARLLRQLGLTDDVGEYAHGA